MRSKLSFTDPKCFWAWNISTITRSYTETSSLKTFCWTVLETSNLLTLVLLSNWTIKTLNIPSLWLVLLSTWLRSSCSKRRLATTFQLIYGASVVASTNWLMVLHTSKLTLLTRSKVKSNNLGAINWSWRITCQATSLIWSKEFWIPTLAKGSKSPRLSSTLSSRVLIGTRYAREWGNHQSNLGKWTKLCYSTSTKISRTKIF